MTFPPLKASCRSYDRYRPLVLSRYHAFVAEGKGSLLSSEPLTMEGSSPSDLTNPAAMAEKAVPPESHPPHPRNPNIIRRRAASARQSLAGEVAAKLRSCCCGRRSSPAPTQRAWAKLAIESPSCAGRLVRRPGKSCRPKIGVLDAGFVPLLTEPPGTAQHCVEACMAGWRTCRGGLSLTNERWRP